MSESKACIFDIQRFSLHDGPGIRTTVFMKGCNLRCFWCHNPESLNPEPEIQEYLHLCIGCGNCVKVCKSGALTMAEGTIIFDRSKCTGCLECTQECFAMARVASGRFMTCGEVANEIQKDKIFYVQSGGGATFSGGEPLLQTGFLKATLALLKKEGIHTAVDTAGNVPFSRLEEVVSLVDLFLYDLKTMDDALHRQATGASNGRILKNLEKLMGIHGNVLVRIPVIPGVNDTEKNMKETAMFLRSLVKTPPVELLRFHKMAEGKYRSLGLPYPAGSVGTSEKNRMETLVKILGGYGLEVRSSG
ncbi:MAG: glycyl-radical enzyme activating protein [Clostridia bacterium]